MTDHYSEAVTEWGHGEKHRKNFALHAAMVEGRQTLALAQDCRISVDTVETYRNAAKLRYEMEREIETPEVSRMWDALNISVWIAASRHKKLGLDVLMEYMTAADEQGMTVEQFGALIGQHRNAKPQWVSRITRLAKGFGKLFTDYKTEIPIAARERLERLFEYMTKELQEVSTMTEESK